MPMLFGDDVLVVFTPEEWRILDRPVHGDGGAQHLLADLLAHQVRPLQVLASYVLLDRAYAYAYDYGTGGFQDRFRVIVRAARRTGKWSAEGMIAKPKRASVAAFGRRK